MCALMNSQKTMTDKEGIFISWVDEKGAKSFFGDEERSQTLTHDL